MSFNKIHRVISITKTHIELKPANKQISVETFSNDYMSNLSEDTYFNIDDLNFEQQNEFIRRFFHTNNIIIVTEKD